MRVAVNVEQLLSPSPGGIGRYTARLVSSLSDLGVEVQPVAARHKPSEVAAAWADFALAGKLPQPSLLPLPRALLYDAWNVLGLPRMSADADILHAPSLAVPPKSGRPLVVSVHDAAPVLFPRAFTARGRWFHAMGLRAAARRADLVITGSRAAAAELAEHTKLPPERTRVVPYGVDPVEVGPDELRETLGRHGLAGVPYVFWAGSLEPRKGARTLVAAMAQLSASGGGTGGTALVMAGYAGWQSRGLIDDDDVTRLGPALRRLGRLPAAELPALYAGASVFAFPSLHEGFGLPVLEAMAAGTPVVGSDIPAVSEVAGGAAVLVAPGDVEAWAAALGGLLADPGRRAELAEAGRRRAATFSWGAMARATLGVYEEALGAA